MCTETHPLTLGQLANAYDPLKRKSPTKGDTGLAKDKSKPNDKSKSKGKGKGKEKEKDKDGDGTTSSCVIFP